MMFVVNEIKAASRGQQEQRLGCGLGLGLETLMTGKFILIIWTCAWLASFSYTCDS